MYFWKVDSLVEDFKSGSVTQKEEFKYILLFTVVTLLCTDPVLYIGSSYNFYDTTSTILLFCITIFGIYFCYKTNKNGDNENFIVRAICLGFPVMVRVVTLFIPIFIIVAGIEVMILEPEAIETDTYENTPLQVATICLFTVIYYWYLSVKIEAVSS